MVTVATCIGTVGLLTHPRARGRPGGPCVITGNVKKSPDIVALVMTRGAITSTIDDTSPFPVAHSVEKKIAAVQCTVLWAMVYAFELFCAFSCIPHNSSLKLELVRIESNLSSSCCLVS